MEKTKVYEILYCGLYYLPAYQIVEHKFYPESKLLPDQDFKESIEELIQACRKYSCKRLLINNEEGHYTLPKDIQHWMHTVAYPQLADLGVSKKATLISFNIFSALSMEETQKKDPLKYTHSRFFHNYMDALDWLSRKIPG